MPSCGIYIREEIKELNSFYDSISKLKHLTKKRELKAKKIEEVTTLVLKADHSGDFKIEKFEVERLIMDIKMIEDLEFDEAMFREKIREGDGDVTFVVRAAKELIMEGDEEEGSGKGQGRRDSFIKVKRRDFMKPVKKMAKKFT